MSNRNRNTEKRATQLTEPATKPGPKPGDFELGSLESRAAARGLADARKKKGMRLQIVEVGPDGARTLGPVIELPPV